MNCGRYRELISRYVDDEVTLRQRQELLAHVQHCHGCAAYMARLRQTDVLLKGVPETKPSDRVRQAILSNTQLAAPSQKPQPGKHQHSLVPAHVGSGLRSYTSGLMLRFEMTPQRIGLAAAAGLLSLVGIAYWMNMVHPMWGYDKFGFLFPHDTEQAIVSPTPIPAISSGLGGVGGPVAAPNVVRTVPQADSNEIEPSSGISIRFDQPMDRASVEGALSINPPAGGGFRWGADNEISFLPAQPGLLKGITYTVSLNSTARSLAGTPLNQAQSWKFYTKSPGAVTPLQAAGSTIEPLLALELDFQQPMDTAKDKDSVKLWKVSDGQGIPAALNWVTESRLKIVPLRSLPPGEIQVHVGPEAQTATGATLGRATDLTYTVSLPAARIKLGGSRIAVVEAGSDQSIRYEAISGEDVALDHVGFSLYKLTGDKLSLLSPQAREWPAPLPAGLVDSLERVYSVNANPSKGEVPDLSTQTLPALNPGTYLLTASSPQALKPLADWQLLVAADRKLALFSKGSIIWATTPGGAPWVGAEISLYSPAGRLIDKGVTQEAGLWAPTHTAETGFAIAQDTAGHVGVLLPETAALHDRPDTGLPCTLTTDMPVYYPGDRVLFHAVLLKAGKEDEALAGESGAVVTLLNPSGSTLSSLTLKPDSVGAIGGLFDLAPDLPPGTYTLRVGAGERRHDFPLTLAGRRDNGLSLYIAPIEAQQDAGAITATVSALQRRGAPAASALVTGTLHINGDSWSSMPVTATTGTEGRTSFTLPLPSWTALYNDPGMYLEVQAQSGENTGSAEQALNLATVRRLMSGSSSLVSPSLNMATIGIPQKEGGTRLRVVSLDPARGGTILVLAQSPNGDSAAWTLEMTGNPDVTLPVPARFAGGEVLFGAPGTQVERAMRLATPTGDFALESLVPEEAAPNSPLALKLHLQDREGQGVEGNASVWVRPVSGLGSLSHKGLGWEPSAHIDASGEITVSLTSPSEPGLWRITAEAFTPGGTVSRSESIVRVMPAPTMLLPDSLEVPGNNSEVTVTFYNPGSRPVSSGVRADGSSLVNVVGNSSQGVELPAGGWQRGNWTLRPKQAGNSTVAFSFLPSAGVPGTWKLPVRADNPGNVGVTYASGVLTGGKTIGVQIPTGLEDANLQVQASTSLRALLVGAAAAVERSAHTGPADWAGALAAPAAIDLLNGTSGTAQHTVSPDIQRSVALQELYALQHADGGWGSDETAGSTNTSSVDDTVAVLLAMKRQEGTSGSALPPVSEEAQRAALTFLRARANLPLGSRPTTAQLDERAKTLYTLGLYDAINASDLRPLLVYAANGREDGLSQGGAAWLGLALLQAGDSADASALARAAWRGTAELSSAAAILEFFTQLTTRTSSNPNAESAYSNPSREAAKVLLEARQGESWPVAIGADALWALSHYAHSEASHQLEGPRLKINDRTVQLAAQPQNPDIYTMDFSSATLHAGTNWLELQATGDTPLYYSLVLSVSR